MPKPEAASKATSRSPAGHRGWFSNTPDTDAPPRPSYRFFVVGVAGTVVGLVAGGILITSPVNTRFTLLMLL